MNTLPSLLPPGFCAGNCRIVSTLAVGDHYADYSVSDLSGGGVSVIREFMPFQWAARDAASGEWICSPENQEGFAREKAAFMASINKEGLCGTFEALNTVFLMYGVPAALSTPTPALPGKRMAAGNKPAMKRPPVKKSGGGRFMAILLTLAILGGGYYVYQNSLEQEKAREAARLEAEAKAQAQAREEAARQAAELAHRRAEEARLRDEAEKKRLADLAKDKDKPAEIAAVDDVPKAPDVSDDKSGRTPVPDSDPRLAVFDKPVSLVGVNSVSKKANEAWDNILETSFETYRFDKYRDFLGKSLKAACAQMVSLKDGEILD